MLSLVLNLSLVRSSVKFEVHFSSKFSSGGSKVIRKGSQGESEILLHSRFAPLDENVTICQKKECGKSVDRKLTNFLTNQMQVLLLSILAIL